MHFAAATGRIQPARSSRELPTLTREDIARMLVVEEGLPQVDWGMADAWIATQGRAGQVGHSAEEMRRAIAAVWLDELRDALTTDSCRWRRASVEGLAPLMGDVTQRVAAAADHSIRIIAKALKEIRGDPKTNPIPAIAVVALGTADEYYSFVSRFYSDEGEYATSGGVYIGSTADEFPVFAINGQTTHQLEQTIAHELTHHALKPDRDMLATCAGLPQWAEEGLTQMMEEHVTRASHFVFNREMLERHRELWDEIGFDEFAEGSLFHSPHGEQQELSYNLAEALTRSLLSTRKSDYLAFARACRNEGMDPVEAARTHLGGTAQELAEALVWGSR